MRSLIVCFLTDKLMRIRDALTPVTTHVYHYWRTNLKPPYLLWAEDAEEPAAEETAAETPAAEETAAPDPSMEAGG